MTANIMLQDRFFAHRTPAWHPLGTVSDEDLSASEVLQDKLDGGHFVEVRPLQGMLNGSLRDSGYFEIVRSGVKGDEREVSFGVTGERYQVIQAYEVCNVFDQKVMQPVETMGFLGDGERMFLTWKLPMSEVVKDDPIQWYGFLAVGFDGKHGIRLYVVSVRVVCQNTWTLAVSQAKSRKQKEDELKGVIFTGKHSQTNLLYLVGEWMGHVQTVAERQVALAESLFGRFANKPITSEAQLDSLLNQAYPTREYKVIVPDSLREMEDQKVDVKNDARTRNRDGIKHLFNGAGTAITPNYWGLFNATTEWFNFGQMEKKPAGLSAVDGNRAANMDRMVKVLQKNL